MPRTLLTGQGVNRPFDRLKVCLPIGAYKQTFEKRPYFSLSHETVTTTTLNIIRASKLRLESKIRSIDGINRTFTAVDRLS